jgi:hypothetical protein
MLLEALWEFEVMGRGPAQMCTSTPEHVQQDGVSFSTASNIPCPQDAGAAGTGSGTSVKHAPSNALNQGEAVVSKAGAPQPPLKALDVNRSNKAQQQAAAPTKSGGCRAHTLCCVLRFCFAMCEALPHATHMMHFPGPYAIV